MEKACNCITKVEWAFRLYNATNPDRNSRLSFYFFNLTNPPNLFSKKGTGTFLIDVFSIFDSIERYQN